MKGPGIFVAQFIGPDAPFNTLPGLARWAGGLGYRALQLPTHLDHVFNLEQAAASQDYCDEIRGTLSEYGLVISELSTHVQGQCVAVHPAYDILFDRFAPLSVRGNAAARTQWACSRLGLAARASARLGLQAHVTFSGALAWPYLYPWPPRDNGLIDLAFSELAARWRPIVDAFEDAGINLCFELHPGEDLHDGTSFERFAALLGNRQRCAILYDPSHMLLQQMDYLAFIDLYHDRIGAFHVKDAEFRPTGRQGVYGGFADWRDRAGRFRSPGDGQIDFGGIFSRLTQYGYDGWAVLEWECCLKAAAQGAREGAPFIQRHMIEMSRQSFDDFAASPLSDQERQRCLGL
ncbi:sugar phosphate isomerase/epimerase family protein [Komagataeibacter rhaeticus]|uniref:Sugar phosphate isomerase/epimerase n=1 Tax=Komagataeibacter rhaeticus TaxID=215221 RepID=A0A181C9B7_9PROT|nr:sugar phosphate isomerase/epimerase [Komagataeibacter rhaeticus]ATU73231.1 sugar phosphate isomerase/epimerase [Komagataeibacter xylinus]QIP35024.1 sugar phosphate isomerase/epimerase [Komagataeibacter rhaeticus]QOC47578.1 sugar phosphate isomerase/epimerase [Komagataeibacter rhaeticus]WPP23076.1 sugar phosphate isomerase/epimerase [Komagataeibacter rhaeticus]SAY48170.1 Inosose dehydratase [Komagataeibacter rhaeticus]